MNYANPPTSPSLAGSFRRRLISGAALAKASPELKLEFALAVIKGDAELVDLTIGQIAAIVGHSPYKLAQTRRLRGISGQGAGAPHLLLLPRPCRSLPRCRPRLRQGGYGFGLEHSWSTVLG
jgi:hypothetical protein